METLLLRQCVGAAFLLLSLSLHAANVVLGWDSTSDTNVVGYRLYYGVAAHNYSYMLDAGNATSVTISNLLDGVTYYLAGTTYNAIGEESGYSSEVSFTVSPSSNSLPQVRGTYSGLFSEPDQVRTQSAGSFTISVNARGAYSGYLQLGANRLSFSGRLGSTGQANKVLRRRGADLTLQLALDASNQPATASGQLSSGSWTAIVQAHRALFDAKSNPAPFAGNYSLLIPGQSGSSTFPAGAGFGVVRINRAGRVTLAGSLADGKRFNQSAQISTDAAWPLFTSLYAGKGLIWSWLSCTNQNTGAFQGQLTWLKPPDSHSPSYPDGFAFQTQTMGSTYQMPVRGSSIGFVLNHSVMDFSGGSLRSDFTNSLAVNSRAPSLGTGSGVWLELSRAAGTFHGFVIIPGGSQVVPFRGVVLQNLGAGYGFLLNSRQSSLVTLMPGD